MQSSSMLASLRRRKPHTLLPRQSLHHPFATSNHHHEHHLPPNSLRRAHCRFLLLVVVSVTLWTFVFIRHHHHRPWTSLRRLSRRVPLQTYDARTVFLSSDMNLIPRSPITDLVPIQNILDPDYNELAFERSFGRQFPDDDAAEYQQQRRQFLYDMDHPYLRSAYDGYEDREFSTDECRPPSWQYVMKPNCNVFHELALEYAPENVMQPYYVQYLAHGYYRESYRFRNKYWKRDDFPESEQMVLKHFRYKDDFSFNIKNQRAVLREAVVMEALGNRPSFANFYGYCSTSTMVEAGHDFVHHVIPKQLEWQNEEGRASQRQLRRHPDPLNALTASQKLKYALHMAEGLAELHGFERGVISHDDIALDQWVLTEEGRVVLSDVNNAMVLEWNETAETYCPYEIDYPYGDLRPAEAYRGNGTATETVDLWGYGTLVFSLLTGMYPFYENIDETKSRELILSGQVPMMDPKYQNRSFIEGRLYHVVQECLRPQPEDRMDMFTVVQYLRETERAVAGVALQSK